MRCKVCRELFTKTYFNQKACSRECRVQMKPKPKIKKPKKKKLQTLLKDFEKVFNAWIRKRDAGKPCISCGQFKVLQAGHFFTVQGYKALRFDEFNDNGECEYCNCWDKNHLIFYAINLKKKIGEDNYNDLLRRAENYKAGRYQNEYYRNGKWDREGIEKGIEYYTRLLAV